MPCGLVSGLRPAQPESANKCVVCAKSGVPAKSIKAELNGLLRAFVVVYGKEVLQPWCQEPLLFSMLVVQLQLKKTQGTCSDTTRALG